MTEAVAKPIHSGENMKRFVETLLAAGFLCLVSTAATALETVKVTKNVYALVGPLGQRSAENLGNNATFGVIVTKQGVILVDSGGSAKGAAEIAAAVADLSDQPITVVINTGGQDHRWFGNAYFAAKGAKIIASEAAVADQKGRAEAQWQMMSALIGTTALAGTEFVYADTRFATTHAFTLGGVRVEIVHPGPAHTPGDAFVWLPNQKIVFSGDIVFMDRLLGVLPYSDSKAWLDAFAAIEKRKPAVVVPGHGRPAPLAKAQAETRDYLIDLRKKIGAFLAAGGTMIDAKKVDQSAFDYLKVFDQISRRNAQAVFAEMEFE